MKLLDIFSGAGGLSLGFEQAGFSIGLGVDFNAQALETFKKNHHSAEIICGDLLNDDIKHQIINFCKENNIKGILGGPPCQGFSLKGKKLGLADERNYLFREYLKIVKEIEPDFIVMENVKALVNTANGYFISEIKNELQNLGLNTFIKVLNAKDYGVPQNRERVFIVGIKNKVFDFNSIIKEPEMNVYDAISDLCFLNSGEGDFKQNYKIDISSNYQKEMRKESAFLYNHHATNHSELALYKLSLIRPEGDKNDLPKELKGNQKFNTTWGRLKWKEVSPTIDTRFDTPSNGRNSHPFLNRAITPREAARLQSFPDNFIFYGKKTEICKQIGNAVPPKLAFSIANAIKNKLSE